MSDPPQRPPGRNVLGGELIACSTDPLTGYYRDGCCNTGDDDGGVHTVCCVVTEEFLDFSLSQGNDLITAMPAYGFPGLAPGDRWCLCASRWVEALGANSAPHVVLAATHERTLQYTTLDTLRAHAID